MLMRLLYRGDYDLKYQAVADLIPPGSKVVDLCAGDCVLAAKLSGKACRYIGLELNPRFVNSACRAGVDARHFDVRTGEIPEADIVCIQSSLYHFMPDDEMLVQRMVESARLMVIISEPIVNVSASGHSLLSRLAVRATAVNGQKYPSRHTLESLTRLMDKIEPRGELVQRHKREAIFVVRTDLISSPRTHDIPDTALLQGRPSPGAECRTRHADARPSGIAV
jgi:hypothetical protein